MKFKRRNKIDNILHSTFGKYVLIMQKVPATALGSGNSKNNLLCDMRAHILIQKQRNVGWKCK